MGLTIEIIGSICAIAFISIAAYGAVREKRKVFLFGVSFFNVVPIIGEALAYALDDNLVHLVIIMMFLVQVIICLPISINYGSENLAAVALSQKIGAAIIVANLFTGYIILFEDLNIAVQFGYFHFVIVLIMLYVTIIIPRKRNAWWS